MVLTTTHDKLTILCPSSQPLLRCREWDHVDEIYLATVGRQILVKLCVASALATTVALATNNSLEQGVRYFAAISLLISLRLAAMALARRSTLQGTLSDWDQAPIFSVIAAVAHFFAGLLK